MREPVPKYTKHKREEREPHIDRCDHKLLPHASRDSGLFTFEGETRPNCPRDVHSSLTFSSFPNGLMRLWPLAVGTSLPETGFDKVDRPSGTSYRVPLLSF